MIPLTIAVGAIAYSLNLQNRSQAPAVGPPPPPPPSPPLQAPVVAPPPPPPPPTLPKHSKGEQPAVAKESYSRTRALAFLSAQLGPEYEDFVNLWSSFEDRTAQSSMRILSRSKRPEAFISWSKSPLRGRWLDIEMNPSFVLPFSQSVRTWWESFQPTFQNEGGLRPTDVDALDKMGFHGWFSLVVCMKWWGMGLVEYEGADRDQLSEGWKTLMKEMCKTLQALLAHLALGSE